MILTPIQKLYNNVVNLGKIIVAPGFEWLPKVQKIAQSGDTVFCTCALYENKIILKNYNYPSGTRIFT